MFDKKQQFLINLSIYYKLSITSMPAIMATFRFSGLVHLGSRFISRLHSSEFS